MILNFLNRLKNM